MLGPPEAGPIVGTPLSTETECRVDGVILALLAARSGGSGAAAWYGCAGAVPYHRRQRLGCAPPGTHCSAISPTRRYPCDAVSPRHSVEPTFASEFTLELPVALQALLLGWSTPAGSSRISKPNFRYF